jgi:hypothetical protein
VVASTGARLCRALALASAPLAAACGDDTGGNPTFGLFAPATRVTLPAGARPTAILLRDFDFDGRPDLALADRGNDGVTAAAGLGDGSFGFPVDYPLGVNLEPVALATADFDLDGKPDLVVANRTGNDVVFLAGTAGAFVVGPGLVLEPGSQASGVVAADFDDDGLPDVAVSNRALGSVTAALGLGDGTFGPLDTYDAGSGTRPAALAADDMNHDGRVDLVVASGNDGRVAVLLGNGDGTFDPAILSVAAPGAQLSAVAVADVDFDAFLDVVATDKEDGTVLVLLGNGDGTFAPALESDAGAGPSGVVIADLDRDGNLDLAVAITGTGSVSVLLGHGDGTFEDRFLFGTAGTGTRSIAVGDVDRDGDRDLVVADETSGSVGVLLSRANRAGSP